MIHLSPRSRRGRRATLLVGALLLMGAAVAHADEEPESVELKEAPRAHCLSEAEIREEVAAKRIIPQVAALRAARAASGGEAVRARVCRGEAGLVYAITSLKRDGKVLRIELDAATGRLVERN